MAKKNTFLGGTKVIIQVSDKFKNLKGYTSSGDHVLS
jgi:hypothetical protein